MSAELLGPGDGERVSEAVIIKLGREELAVTESDYGPGRKGAGPHIHRTHADCWWVLEGELAFGIGHGERLTAGPGDFVMVPTEVVHSFDNGSQSERARFLNLHAPGAGFDDYMRAVRDGDKAGVEAFDAFDPPEDGGRPASDVRVLRAGEGEGISIGEAGGGLTLALSTAAVGTPGPALHAQERQVDTFYVLDGTLTLRLADGDTDAGPGTYGVISPGTAYSFANRTDEPVRALTIAVP